jgi:ADP-L-glycero-D-manno-heptose 6-epimerase
MIVITGGAGLIGSALLARLNQEGIFDVVVADRLSTDLRWKNLVNARFIDYINGANLLEALEKGVYGKVDAIVHLGANSYTTERDAGLVMENNYAFSKQLARYSLQHGVRFIYASSAGTYGDGSLGFDDDPALMPQLRPITLYGFSKQAFDLWTMDAKVYDKVCGIKFFNVYGPNGYHKSQLPSGQRQFETLRDTGVVQLFKSDNPAFGDGESTRDFVYIKDTAEVLLWLLQNPKVCGIYNLGSGEACSWNRLARAVCAAAKKPERIEYIPMPPENRGKYQYHTQATMTRLRAAGYTKPFTSIEEGMADFVQNYLNFAEYRYL